MKSTFLSVNEFERSKSPFSENERISNDVELLEQNSNNNKTLINTLEKELNKTIDSKDLFKI